MKLSDVASPISLGMREIEERKRLAEQAKAARDALVRERVVRLSREAQVSDAAAARALEAIEVDPRAYLTNIPTEEPKKPLKVSRTPGQVKSIEDTIRCHLLAVESLARLLPDEKRTEHRDPLYHAVEALERIGRP